jgi:hypothetical protein
MLLDGCGDTFRLPTDHIDCVASWHNCLNAFIGEDVTADRASDATGSKVVQQSERFQKLGKVFIVDRLDRFFSEGVH